MPPGPHIAAHRDHVQALDPRAELQAQLGELGARRHAVQSLLGQLLVAGQGQLSQIRQACEPGARRGGVCQPAWCRMPGRQRQEAPAPSGTLVYYLTPRGPLSPLDREQGPPCRADRPASVRHWQRSNRSIRRRGSTPQRINALPVICRGHGPQAPA